MTTKNFQIFKEWISNNSSKDAYLNAENEATIIQLQNWLNLQKQIPKPKSGINWKNYKVAPTKIDVGGGDKPAGFHNYSIPPRAKKAGGERNYGLVPTTVMVNTPGKSPYFAIRWKSVQEVEQDKGEFYIIPVDSYDGDLHVIFDAWKAYVNSFETEQDNLLIPLVALQEIIFNEYDGIFMARDNRIVGIVSLRVDENYEVEISLLSAAPPEIKDNQEEYIEEALHAGVQQYVESRDYHLVDYDEEEEGEETEEEEVDSGDINKSEMINELWGDSIRLLKEVTSLSIYEHMVVAKLFPKSGDPKNPQHWILKDTYFDNLEAQVGKKEANAFKKQMDGWLKEFESNNKELEASITPEKREKLNIKRQKEEERAKKRKDMAPSKKGKKPAKKEKREEEEVVSDTKYSRPEMRSKENIHNILKGEGIPMFGPVNEERGQRKIHAGQAENYLSAEQLMEDAIKATLQPLHNIAAIDDVESRNKLQKENEKAEAKNFEVIQDWFLDKYLVNPETKRRIPLAWSAVQMTPKWKDFKFAENPHDPSVDLLFTAKDMSGFTPNGLPQTKYGYKRKYEGEQQSARFALLTKLMDVYQPAMDRAYHDIFFGEGRATQNTSKEDSTRRLRDAALVITLEDMTWARTGNTQNIQSRTGMKKNEGEPNIGMMQTEPKHIKFGQDKEGNAKALFQFQGKEGVKWSRQITDSDIVEELRWRTQEALGRQEEMKTWPSIPKNLSKVDMLKEEAKRRQYGSLFYTTNEKTLNRYFNWDDSYNVIRKGEKIVEGKPGLMNRMFPASSVRVYRANSELINIAREFENAGEMPTSPEDFGDKLSNAAEIIATQAAGNTAPVVLRSYFDPSVVWGVLGAQVEDKLGLYNEFVTASARMPTLPKGIRQEVVDYMNANNLGKDLLEQPTQPDISREARKKRRSGGKKPSASTN